MNIDFEYLSRIRTAFSLRTMRKTTNILEGDFRSVYRGRSMEFDELSAYMTGDDVHDIDWKSSSRTGQILVRRYVAERKHYLLFAMDCGVKMLADTSLGEYKKDIACMTFGSAAFLADRAGADFSLIYGHDETIEQDIFRSGMTHLEKLMHVCADAIGRETAADAAALLEYAAEHVKKRTIIVLITDIDGLMRLSERLIEKVLYRHDLMVVNIDDAYLTDIRAFEVESARYADTFMVRSGALKTEEHRLRARMLAEREELLRRMRVGFVTVTKEAEIVDRVIDLFRDR